MGKNILITKGTRPFARRVARQLSVGQRIIFGAADEMPEVLLNSGDYVRLPQSGTPVFVHEMLKTCLDMEVGLLIPLGQQELGRLIESKMLFEEYGIQVLLPDKQLMETLMVVENPPAKLPLMVLNRGVAVNDPASEQLDSGLSGVFAPLDSSSEVALCYIAD